MIKIFGYYKYARTIFVLIALVFGMNIDLDHLNYLC